MAETLTIRMEEETKRRLEEEAKKSDQTVTEYVARAVKMRWEGACSTCGRDMGGAVIQPPGMSAAFTAWVAKMTEHGRRSPYVALVTNEPMGNRIYTGTFLPDYMHDSYISLSLEVPEDREEDSVILPIMRQYIVAWESRDYARNLRNRLGSFFRYADVALATFPQLGRNPQR